MAFFFIVMKKQFALYFIILFYSIHLYSFAQTNYPTDYFQSPLNSTISLVGNFGEIRPNHFHAGFDIRTGGQEGMAVNAVADGYVSRIKISSSGYGKALYVTHPNGYTSVYGHLQGYAKDIAAYAKKIQYANEAFEIDTLLTPDALPVKKREQIAFSGNTGSSSGPHLHFEIRNTKSEMPINLYEFGYKVPDNTKPKITEIVVFPIGKTASVNGKQVLKKIKPINKNDKYTIAPADSIVVNGEMGFGINCFDTESGSTNHNGVFSVELQIGGERVYYHQLETFSFDNSRYVNAHIDYPEKQKHNDIIQRCFVSKNNKVEIYKDVINNGVDSFTDDSVHLIKYIVKDFVGNTTELLLKVKSTSHTKIKEKEVDSKAIPFDCLTENKFENFEIKITIPPDALYDDVNFIYSKTLDIKAPYAPLHHIMDEETALQKSYSLSIKSIKVPDSLQKKACIVSISGKRKESFEGGTYKDGWVTTETKDFGNFTIAIDNTPPRINYAFTMPDKNNVDLSKAKTIGIIATDDLSGIKKYRATIDGNWVLCEYEPKKDLLYYTFDGNIKTGEHTFKIEVSDDKNNMSTLSFKFKR